MCKGNGVIFINNSNIESTCLNWSKLHLNKSGTYLFIKTFPKTVNFVWLINENDNGEVLDTIDSSSVSLSRVSYLCNVRSKNTGTGNIILSYLNINSIRNKFENLFELVAGNVEILCISETKLDPSFPNL